MTEIAKTDKEISNWIKKKPALTRSAKDFAPAELTPQDWETVVSRCSDYGDWSKLLQLKPEYADKCPWEKLDGTEWRWLLEKQPQFADKRPPARSK